MCNVLEAARLSGIKRVVYASSETVYGSQDDYGDREVTEDDRLYMGPATSTRWQNAWPRIMAEEYSGVYGLSCTGLRPTIVFGHGATAPFVVKCVRRRGVGPRPGRTAPLRHRRQEPVVPLLARRHRRVSPVFY